MTSKWPLNDLSYPLGPENITFLPNLTFGHLICLFIGFCGRWVVCAYQIWVSSHQMTSKWPLNDLQWPQNKTFLPNLTLEHAICLFLGFLVLLVDCTHQICVSNHQMTSKWPLNDLKWPIVTCKRNFLTKSHFGACYMSFHRFLWMPSWLRLSDLSFDSPNDL